MSDRTTKAIASKLREIRAKKHLTQAEVATQAGISTNYYARIERGDAANISLEVLEVIVKALKVKSSEVLPF